MLLVSGAIGERAQELMLFSLAAWCHAWRICERSPGTCESRKGPTQFITSIRNPDSKVSSLPPSIVTERPYPTLRHHRLQCCLLVRRLQLFPLPVPPFSRLTYCHSSHRVSHVTCCTRCSTLLAKASLAAPLPPRRAARDLAHRAPTPISCLVCLLRLDLCLHWHFVDLGTDLLTCLLTYLLTCFCLLRYLLSYLLTSREDRTCCIARSRIIASKSCWCS